MNDKSHLPCPCGKSSDAYSIKNGFGHCFVCDKNFREDGNIEHQHNKAQPEVEKPPTPFKPLPSDFRDFPERGLSKNTMQRYGAWRDLSDDSTYYPIFRDGRHVGNKIRKPNKQFFYEGDIKEADLYGQQAFPPGSAKYITVTEGQDDAKAVYEMTGSRFPAVSVHSSSTAEKDVRRNFEYLDSFDHIVFCFDNDDAGQVAAKKVANIGFKLGKVQFLKLRKAKDANDYKLAGKAAEFTKEWWDAPVYKPDGLLLGTELWESIIHRPNHFTVPYPFEGFNKLTYGMRLSEVTVINAPTGVGKTSIVKTIEHSLLVNEELKKEGYGVGFLHLEEPYGDTALGLISIHNGKPYHLPDVDKPVDELRAAYDVLLNNDRVVIWDHFGSNSVDAVLDKVRHMHALGCRYIVIDHLSIIVSDQSGDERKQLDEISTKLKTLCMQLNIHLICIIHQNRQGEIRGTAGVEQLANTIFKLSRLTEDANEWRRNVLVVVCTKNRFAGRTGPAAYLHYDETTGRLRELSREEIDIYNEGGNPQDDMQPF